MKNPNIPITVFKNRFSGNYLHLGNHCGVVLYGIEIPKRIWRHYLQDSPSYGIYDTTSRDSFISDKAKQVARGSVPFRLLFSIIVCTSNLKANFSYGKETSIFLQQESALNSFFNFCRLKIQNISARSLCILRFSFYSRLILYNWK